MSASVYDAFLKRHPPRTREAVRHDLHRKGKLTPRAEAWALRRGARNECKRLKVLWRFYFAHKLSADCGTFDVPESVDFFRHSVDCARCDLLKEEFRPTTYWEDVDE